MGLIGPIPPIPPISPISPISLIPLRSTPLLSKNTTFVFCFTPPYGVFACCAKCAIFVGVKPKKT